MHFKKSLLIVLNTILFIALIFTLSQSIIKYKELKLNMEKSGVVALIDLADIQNKGKITWEFKNYEQNKDVELNNDTAVLSDNETIEPINQESPTPQDHVQPAVAESKKQVLIIVSSVGLSEQSTLNVFKMPEQVAISFSPYSAEVSRYMNAATNDKHDVALNLPVQSAQFPVDDPGPYGLIISDDQEKMIQKLEFLHNKLGTAEFVLVTGSDGFTVNPEKNQYLLDYINSNNIKIIYAGSNKDLRGTGNIYNVGELSIIDSKLTNKDINNNLQNIEEIIEKEGRAVVVIQPYPISVKVIMDWIATFEAKQYKLVTIKEYFNIEDKKQ